MDKKMYPENEYKCPEYELAHAYVPYQKMCKVYEPGEGLCKGTIFPELYKPYKVYDKKKKC
ncbi:spore coat associated protein CotJA [Clostridium sp. D2Q-11]|uniref:Spore coat associated protein CotJA n=1 Tax=Anaeromonas frigoriresistens TaxID=2683708 RepID=A0A942UTF8_9FIRM|nr:spore coat associated protein CotJA [Anaeromonas frigoriresistens]MBS4538258.1 spore coat associated protein CotJA [Anaeromonas frigoriresistens]